MVTASDFCWACASWPWRRLLLLHRFSNRKYVLNTFAGLDVIQKQPKRQGRAPQSNDLPFQVGQLEAGDGAPHGHEAPVVRWCPRRSSA